MNLTNSGDRHLIVTSHASYITMMIEDPTDGSFEAVEVDPDTWVTIMPYALSECTGGLLELSMLDIGSEGSDARRFDADEDLLSFFNLAAILECCALSSIAGAIARCWMRLPLEHRAAWWHQASSDKPIYAQLLPAIDPASPVFRTSVPAWLPKLIDVGDFRRGIIRPFGLHWAYSRSSLGTSCIAFLDDRSDNHDACLALSDCPVSCGAADGSMRQPALIAIDQLIACHDAIRADRTLPGEVAWHPNAHDLLDIGATLGEWRIRIEQMTSPRAATP